MIRRPPRSTLFPYTDALPIFLIGDVNFDKIRDVKPRLMNCRTSSPPEREFLCSMIRHYSVLRYHGWSSFRRRLPDRKSTRLNSSHANISYAVFCLKKKNYSTL